MNAAQAARAAYEARCAEVRRELDVATRAFADAMSAASLEYERAMAADIGAHAARKKGARCSHPGCTGTTDTVVCSVCRD